MNQFKSLYFLRSIFIIFVFLSHYSNLNGRIILSTGGVVGVAFFFIISGFSLSLHNTHLLEVKRLVFFYKKRLIKIFSFHLLMILYYIFNIIVHGKNIPSSFLPKLILIQSWFPDSNIYFGRYGVSWYLSTLLFLYLVFPFIIKFVKDISLKVRLAVYLFYGLLIVGCALIFDRSYLKYIFYINPLVRLIDFSIGVELGNYFKTNKFKISPTASNIMVTLSLFIFIVFVLIGEIYYNQIKPVNYSIYWWISIILLISSFTIAELKNRKGLIIRIISYKIFRIFAEVSMVFYLIHYLLIGKTKRILDILNINSIDIINILISLSLTFFASIVLHYCIENKIIYYLQSKIVKNLEPTKL